MVAFCPRVSTRCSFHENQLRSILLNDLLTKGKLSNLVVFISVFTPRGPLTE